MDRINITCTDTGKTVGADVLSRSNNRLEVAVDGSKMKITLHRNKATKPYVGTVGKMEFTA